MRSLKTFLVLTILGLAVSCEDILEVADISNESITILAPKDSVILTNTDVQFNWDKVEEADGYHLQLATPNFENATQILIDSVMVIDSTFVGTKFVKTLDYSTYEWRIKAFNSGYDTAFSSGHFSVEVSNN